jgi:ribosomal protein S18 acetylase RimI-like enzyme
MIAARRANAEHIPALVEMMHEFYAEAHYPLDRVWATSSFAALLENENYGAVFIVFHKDVPAGYAVLSVRFSMEYGGLEGFIDDLFVRAEHRRSGLGRAVLDALFAECKQRNVVGIQVEVGSDNEAAKALYNRFGLQSRDDNREVLIARLGNAVC